jgi:outer membrane protein insertion porin family
LNTLKRRLKYATTFAFLILWGISRPLSAQGDSSLYEPYNFIDPEEYTIKDIRVSGARYIQEALVTIYSGLSINQKIKIPGDAIPTAIENLWKQQFFADIQIGMKKLPGRQVVLTIYVSERSKLSKFSIKGLKKGETKNLREEISLKSNMIITQNLLNKTRKEILDYYVKKGYYSASVAFKREPEVNKPNFEIIRISVDKGEKVKVFDIRFTGNEHLTDAELRKVFKKTKRLNKKWNILASSKFIEEKYEEEKAGIEAKYNALGYRDARVLYDSVIQIAPDRLLISIGVTEGIRYHFRNISWRGNTKFRSGMLDTLLGIKKGDVYNQALLQERLFANTGGYDIQSLYMDDGYLFFNMQPVEVAVSNDSIDMEIRLYEGEQARVNRVTISGNTKTSDHVVLREIRTKPGDKFSRSDIQRTMRDLAQLGYFDPEQMGVDPVPNQMDGTVDIKYKVSEKPSDQIELSGGWGANGFTGRPALLGTAGITLNNFSIRKLGKPSLWNPIPSGDGQRLSLRAQSNGTFYQGYNFSFTEPWLGGKKPNSFSVSLFHTINAYDYAVKTDPNRRVLMNTGASISFGKRLRWPDDFFSMQWVFSFQRYRFQNLSGSGFGFPADFKNGTSYVPSIQFVLTRNSVSAPIFPESGSQFTFSLQATPPYSAFSGKDYASMLPADKYRWIEYHKWKFDANWYTLLFKNCVLSTQARFGFLGFYNRDLGMTFFERFRLGGSGLFGFSLAGTEIISQRGYDNFTVSDAASRSESGVPIYNKLTTEIRYAITKNPTATVYGHVFAEAGNAYVNFNSYNPFQDLRRAVGVGVRLFMPMFGLIGLDYAYGFDWRLVTGNSKPGQFHFFLGQQF